MTNTVKLSFVNKSKNKDPEYSCVGDSGFDLRAMLDEPITIKPLERQLVHTGLYFKLPENYEIQVRPRSGLALKNGITVLNTPGTVDECYTGEICVILANISNEDFVVQNGDRIAQAVLCRVSGQRAVELVRVEELEDNIERGSNGFGHSGVK